MDAEIPRVQNRSLPRSYELSNIVGIAIALICFALLLTAGRKVQPTDDLSV